MRLFNKCKVCGENVGLFNTELENPNDWAYDDYEKDKARGFSINICPKCKTKYKTKPVNRTLITIIVAILGCVALLCHILFDIGYLVAFFGIFVCGTVAGYIILDSLDDTFEQVIENDDANKGK